MRDDTNLNHEHAVQQLVCLIAIGAMWALPKPKNARVVAQS